VESNNGCVEQTTKVIRVGIRPTVDFEWTKICSEHETTLFTDKTTTGPFSAINTYQWNFGDGSAVHPASAGTSVFPEGGSYKDPEHEYSTFQVYDVRLTVSTTDGCTAFTDKKVVILQYARPTPSNGYFTDFELGPGSWVSLPIVTPGSEINSWSFTNPSSDPNGIAMDAAR
jgi:PKD repeat protein